MVKSKLGSIVIYVASLENEKSLSGVEVKIRMIVISKRLNLITANQREK